MKIQPRFFLLAWLTILPAAYSQPNGIAEGRLVNRTDPAIVAGGVELEVIELGSGMSIVRTATTDASGKFRIEGLPEDRRLMIRANYQAANYHGQLSFNSSGRAYVEIEVYEPAASMKEIPVEGIQMAFQVMGDRLKSLETITYHNKTSPPRTYTSPEGNFRISKSPGILDPPQIRVTAPGSTMPLVQPALESADGKSYYSLYPLRPGITTFEVEQMLPYADRSYTYTKRFYQDAGPIDIGVIPRDMTLSGKGLSKIETNAQDNFAVYRNDPVKAGSEIVWTFSGPASGPESSETAGGDSTVTAMPGVVRRNALVIGPLLLLGFILVLWYAFSRSQGGSPKAGGLHIRQLKELREQLIDAVAELDHRSDTNSIGGQEFQKQREASMRRLRRISLLLKKQ